MALAFGLAVMVSMVLLFPTESWAIPAFSRRYGIQCGACHSAFPALNAFGEGFRLSGYRRFAGGALAPKTPSGKIRERLELRGTIPFSFSTEAGYNFAEIDNALGNRQKNVNTANDFTRTQSSFTLRELKLLAAALLGPHLSFHRQAPLGETEIRQFFDPEVRRKTAKFDVKGPEIPERAFIGFVEGPEIPERAFIGFHDIFVQDFLNLKAGLIDLPTAFSPLPRRLSFFPYLVYEATALDVISHRGLEDFVSVPGIEEGTLERNQFRLSKGQVGLQLFGQATPSLHRTPGLYIDYVIGVVNGNNINIDNNTTKDVFGRLAFTYPILNTTFTVGGFGYYSGNTLDSLTSHPKNGVRYRNRLWRAGPDISLTLNAPVYINIFSQILFGGDTNATGFRKAATWWGGFVQAEVKPLSELIVYARYDWINGNRFNDTNVTINGVSGTIGTVNPKLWDAVAGVQYFLYDNFKLIAEYRHGKKELGPDNPTVSQLIKIEENAVFVGFRLAF